MTSIVRRGSPVILAAVAAIAAGASLAQTAKQEPKQDIKLPPTLAFTAYDTGTAGFNITVAIAKMMKEKHGTDVRVLPAGNDVARLAPLRAGRAQLAGMGAGNFFAQEGVYEFASRDWGPQPLRMTLSALECSGGSLGVAKDTGVKEVKDLKGKRVGIVVGSPALNSGAMAVLAFAGLGKNDVKLVEFSSYGAMWKGMVNNDVDAAFANTQSAPTKEVETSPRGIVWPFLHHADTAGWERLRKVAPYMAPQKATCGSGGISPTNVHELSAYPYPMYTAYQTLSDDLVYAIARSMLVNFDDYKDNAPGAYGMALSRQLLQWEVPYHPAAIRAIKEAGAWSDADDQHNNGLLRRQDVLAKAWAAHLKANSALDDAAFKKSWMAARREALGEAGLKIGVDE